MRLDVALPVPVPMASPKNSIVLRHPYKFQNSSEMNWCNYSRSVSIIQAEESLDRVSMTNPVFVSVGDVRSARSRQFIQLINFFFPIKNWNSKSAYIQTKTYQQKNFFECFVYIWTTTPQIYLHQWKLYSTNGARSVTSRVCLCLNPDKRFVGNASTKVSLQYYITSLI